MKTAFFGKSKVYFELVFSPALRERVAQISELVTTELVGPENFSSFDLSEVEAIFATWGMYPLTDEQLAKMPKLKAVFYAAGAADTFGAPLLSHNIAVSSAWRANAVPVAEFAMAQIILSLKNYFGDGRTYTSRAGFHAFPGGPGIYDETVALIGNGAVSTHLKKLLESCLKLEIIQIPTDQAKDYALLKEVFSKAYVVSNHLPNVPDTEGLLNEELFRSMRPNATFINTGRGAQVDEAGLIRALTARKDLTALLDVTWPEPPVEDSPLYKLPNVRLSSHLAGSIHNETRRMAELAIGEFLRFEKGLPLEHPVTWKDISAGGARKQ